jgi:hypothetical protein
MAFESEITDDLDEPYSRRSTAALPPYSSPSVIGVAGRPYLLDTESNDYRRVSVEVLQQRNTANQRDLLLLPQGIWRQSVQSWHQGAGQSNIDRDNSLPYRFRDSYGVNPWTWWEASLHASCSLLPDTDAMTGRIWLTTYESYLAVVNTSSITWFDSLGASAAYGTTTPNASATIVDVATSAPAVTVLYSDGSVLTTDGPAASPLLNGIYASANFIGYEKDYLIAGVNNTLQDISIGSPGSLIFTHPVPGFRWVDAAAGNSCIYVLGGVADRYVVHRVGIKEDGTGLDPAIVAATLPDGEIGYSIGSYLGFVFIGTNKGVRMAASSSSGDLTLGALIPTTTAVNCFEGQDKYVWYGNSRIDGSYPTLDSPDLDALFPPNPVVGLGRMDLTSFTVTELTPAYANDLVAATVTTGETRSVVTYGDKRVFSIDSGGVWFESDEFMPGGWIEQGIMSFSVEDSKTALYAQANWEPLQGSIILDMSFDSLGYARFGEYTTEGTIRSQNTDLNGTVFSRAEARLLLFPKATDSTLGPTLNRFEFRARPARGKASRWTLPILNHEVIELDGSPETRDPLIEYDRLIDLVESGTMFVYQESKRAYQCVATEFTWVPQKVTENGKAWQGVFVLTIEEIV